MILILNGTVYTMVSEPIYEGAILIENKKIKKIYHKGEKLPNGGAEQMQIIDAEGGFILPGFIDSHCHVGVTEEKKGECGDDGNENVNPVTPYLSALDAINPMDEGFCDAVRSGITSVMTGPGSSNVVGGQFVLIKTHGKIVDDMVIMTPAAMKVAFGENPKMNYKSASQSPVTKMSIASILRQELFLAKQYKEKKDRAVRNGEYFEADFQYESWLPVLEKRIPMKAHVHRADDIMTAIRIAKEYDVNLTLDHCTEGHLIAKRLGEEGYPAIIGPNFTTKNKLELENKDLKTAGVLYHAGVNISICTDHPVSLIQSLPICAGLAVKAGLPMEEGLKAITVNAAKICNVAHRIGSLSEGMDADIAIFDGNPMETFTNTLYTIIDGEVVYDSKREDKKYGEGFERKE